MGCLTHTRPQFTDLRHRAPGSLYLGDTKLSVHETPNLPCGSEGCPGDRDWLPLIGLAVVGLPHPDSTFPMGWRVVVVEAHPTRKVARGATRGVGVYWGLPRGLKGGGALHITHYYCMHTSGLWEYGGMYAVVALSRLAANKVLRVAVFPPPAWFVKETSLKVRFGC